jgi:hypothetical protein
MPSATRRQRYSCVFIFRFFVFCLIGPALAFSQVPVLTEHNDVSRSGANAQETYLTPGNVNVNTFGQLFTEPVDGFIVGQPLYVPGVQFPGGTTHNVVYVATQHDSVFAFDADTAQPPLWTVSFINPSAGITTVPISDYGCAGTAFTEIGVVSTPVIDAASETIFALAKTLENGAYVFRLHSLSLTTGADVVAPSVISASVSTNSGTLQFNPAVQMQRPALLLENGAVYVAFGSNGCDTYSYHGWLLAYDETTLQQTGVFVDTPNGTQGAIWQAGGGPAADTDGTIFFATANGTFDANTGGSDYGDSILHLSPASSGMTVFDYFTPYNQADLAENDIDLGSGGVMLLPDQPAPHSHELVGGGKEGTLYLIDRDNMGGFNPSGDTQIVQSIVSASAGEMDSVPAYWNGNVYIGGQSDYIKAFALSNDLLSPQPTSQTSVLGPTPGSVSISANGTNDAILWGIPLNSPATLYAFDATNLATTLYSSSQNYGRDKLGTVPKFVPPTVANGKVYVGSTTQVAVYGLLPVISAIAGSNQSEYVGTTLPVAIQIQTADAYQGKPIASVSVTCKDGGAGGSFSVTMPMVTNAEGQASTTYTLPKKAQTVTILCTNSAYVSGSFTEAGIAGPVTRASIVSGNKQTGSVSTALPANLVTQVLDPYGYGVPGVTVSYSDGGAGGSFSPATMLTDSLGNATTSYTTPANPGTVTITATTAGLSPLKFSETVVSAGPNFSVSATPGTLSVTQGSSSPITITVNPAGGFNGSVTLTASGLPSGVAASFNPATTASTSTLTLTASSSAASGPATITVTGTSGSMVQTTNIGLTVTAPANFSLSATPGTLSVMQGSSSPTTITINPTGGFTGSVALAASGLPSGVTASFNPASTSSTSTLTLTASSAATTGAATITVTGTSGSIVQTTNLNITVNAPASYSISAGTPNPATINPGSISTIQLSLASANGYTGSVMLACSVAPVVSPAATCSIGNTNPVTVTSAGGSAMLTFTTVGPTTTSRNAAGMLNALWLPLPALAFIGFSVRSGSARRKKIVGLMALWALLAFTIVLPACGGGGGMNNTPKKGSTTSGTPAGTYTITITGKDANGLAQSNAAPTVTITVN